MNKKSFEHYIRIYCESIKECYAAKSEEESDKAYLKLKNASERMMAFYPEQTKETLIDLMDDRDIRVSSWAAREYAINFDMDLELKNKIRDILRIYKNSKYGSPMGIGPEFVHDIEKSKKQKAKVAKRMIENKKRYENRGTKKMKNK